MARRRRTSRGRFRPKGPAKDGWGARKPLRVTEWIGRLHGDFPLVDYSISVVPGRFQTAEEVLQDPGVRAFIQEATSRTKSLPPRTRRKVRALARKGKRAYTSVLDSKGKYVGEYTDLPREHLFVRPSRPAIKKSFMRGKPDQTKLWMDRPEVEILRGNRRRFSPKKRPELWSIDDILRADAETFDKNTRIEKSILYPQGVGDIDIFPQRRPPIELDEELAPGPRIRSGKRLKSMGPHARLAAGGRYDPDSDQPLKDLDDELSPMSKEQIIKELINKYPSKSQNRKNMKHVTERVHRQELRKAKRELGRFSTAFGIRKEERPGRVDLTEIIEDAFPDLKPEQIPSKMGEVLRAHRQSRVGGVARYGSSGAATMPKIQSDLEVLLKTRVKGNNALVEAMAYVSSIVEVLGTTRYKVGLIAEAFRPTYEKALRYTPFNPYQRTRVHLLETAEFEYGVVAGSAFIRATWGGFAVPHAEHVYNAPDWYQFQGEGKPRWLEKAIDENKDQFMRLVEEFLFDHLLTGLAEKREGEKVSPEARDKALQIHLLSTLDAAMQGERAFRKLRGQFMTPQELRGPRGLVRPIQLEPTTAEQWLSEMSEFYVPSGYGPGDAPEAPFAGKSLGHLWD